jgi:hypothetical protein
MTGQTLADEVFNETLQEATGALERALHAPPLQIIREGEAAQRGAVLVRDELIRRLRQDPESSWKPALEQVNMAISLITGIEYPSNWVRREVIEQARNVLMSLQEK